MRLPQPYADAYRRAVAETTPTGPEMIGVHLAKMCAAVAGVDGAGISVFSGDIFRTPIGASTPTATAAERLQFTVGEGPCLTAHARHRPVFAPEDRMAAIWPAFHQELVRRTPFHGIIALPFGVRGTGVGSIDLYVRRSDDLADVPEPVLTEVPEMVAGMLAEHFLTLDPADDSDPPPDPRHRVTMAMGMITVAGDLSFPDALAVLRAHAFVTGRTVDEVSSDLVDRSLPIAELGLHPTD